MGVSNRQMNKDLDLSLFIWLPGDNNTKHNHIIVWQRVKQWHQCGPWAFRLYSGCHANNHGTEFGTVPKIIQALDKW